MALIEFKSLGKSYVSRSGRNASAVRNFNLELESGEFFCLLGPSGCGKTTVLAMLAGFEQPTRGAILLGGQAVDRPSRDRGVVFQGDDSLYPWLTAIENIEFGLRVSGLAKAERKKTAREYLQLVGLGGQQDKYPSELSGGMKQRIQIARALANRPKMLLMDEPFGALDALTREKMNLELLRIWEKSQKTIVFVTHGITEAVFLGTRVIVLTAGPARMADNFTVELPHPRTLDMKTNEQFGEYTRRIYRLLGME